MKAASALDASHERAVSPAAEEEQVCIVTSLPVAPKDDFSQGDLMILHQLHNRIRLLEDEQKNFKRLCVCVVVVVVVILL